MNDTNLVEKYKQLYPKNKVLKVLPSEKKWYNTFLFRVILDRRCYILQDIIKKTVKNDFYIYGFRIVFFTNEEDLNNFLTFLFSKDKNIQVGKLNVPVNSSTKVSELMDDTKIRIRKEYFFKKYKYRIQIIPMYYRENEKRIELGEFLNTTFKEEIDNKDMKVNLNNFVPTIFLNDEESVLFIKISKSHLITSIECVQLISEL